MAEEIKKGLMGIVVDETTISQVMPEINSLTYWLNLLQNLKCKENIFLTLNPYFEISFPTWLKPIQ